MTSEPSSRIRGKQLWNEYDRKQRRRIAAAVRTGEQLADPREAELALYFAARDQRQLRVIWVYITLAGLSGFALSAHAGHSIITSMLFAALFAAMLGSLLIPIWIREIRRLKRAEAANQQAKGGREDDQGRGSVDKP